MSSVLLFKHGESTCEIGVQSGRLVVEHDSDILLKSVMMPIDFEGKMITPEMPDIFMDALLLKYDPHALHAKNNGQFMAKPGAKRSRFRVDGKASGHGSVPKAKNPRDPNKDFRAHVREHKKTPYDVRGSQQILARLREKAVHSGEDRTGQTQAWRDSIAGKEGDKISSKELARQKLEADLKQKEADAAERLKDKSPAEVKIKTKTPDQESHAAYQESLDKAKAAGGQVDAWKDLPDSELKLIIKHGADDKRHRFGVAMAKHVLELRDKEKYPPAKEATPPAKEKTPKVASDKSPAANPQMIRDMAKAEYVPRKRKGETNDPNAITHPNNHKRGHDWAIDATPFNMNENGLNKLKEFKNNVHAKMNLMRGLARSGQANFFKGAHEAIENMHGQLAAHIARKAGVKPASAPQAVPAPQEPPAASIPAAVSAQAVPAPIDPAAANLNAIDHLRANAAANAYGLKKKGPAYKKGYLRLNQAVHLHPAALDVARVRAAAANMENERPRSDPHAEMDRRGQIDAANHLANAAEEYQANHPNEQVGPQQRGPFPAKVGVKFHDGKPMKIKARYKPRKPKEEAIQDLPKDIKVIPSKKVASGKFAKDGSKKSGPMPSSSKTKADKPKYEQDIASHIDKDDGSGHPIITGKLPTNPEAYKRIGEDVDCVNKVYLTKMDNGAMGVYKPDSGADDMWEEKFGKGVALSGHEKAASVLNDALGFNIVPKVSIKTGVDQDGKKATGSVMQFIPNAKTAAELWGSDREKFKNSISETDRVQMQVIDLVAGNSDRHGNNWMVDKSGKAFAIDNGGAFLTDKQSENDGIQLAFGRDTLPTKMPKEVADGIGRMLANRKTIKKNMKGLITTEQMNDMFSRAKYLYSIRDANDFNKKCDAYNFPLGYAVAKKDLK